MSSLQKYIVARIEPDGYSTRGPVAVAMTIEDAAHEGTVQATKYPDQNFVIMGVVGEVTRINAIVVKPCSETGVALPPSLKAVTGS